ncbi:MAG: DUF5320 domain-containing protein [Nanoarchaeota archaeon]|nr:DUF5320 domain-containing protein [Nanoarchaeota archaeon]MBU1501202.1 DUF5320 domain-containing protein [Nanoarchaeota archaeon]MBU2458913.1 DUF5320 domain-containing protein [Nanoarchaeota archaeon]
MPAQDRTGPQGLGSLTGRGFGPCGCGMRRGCGMGFGRGLEFRRKTLTEIEEKKILEEELKEIELENKRWRKD